MATTVRITETYDLKTEVGKIGLIGIHTPSDTLLRKLYPGLMKNHRYVRFKKCDIVGACASVLPADPLQVGVEAGDIAPEDLFNPILMRPVSNSSFATLASRIYGAPGVGALGSVCKTDGYLTADDYKVYYSLLAESKRFKKAMPQKGFAMRGLYPLMHTLLSSFGDVTKIGNKYVLSEDGETPTSVPSISDIPVINSSAQTTASDAVVMRGRTVKMPKIPLHYEAENTDTTRTINIPKTFVACVITPPARLHSFYYRMRVTWTCSFESVISATEFGGTTKFAEVADASYKGYTYESSKTALDTSADLVDSSNIDLNKVIEA